jgi:HAD superfamily hydrolase (TIGR01509 family)
MAQTPPAVLFDVDGTLVDTNWFHTLSWWRAFQKAGEDIAMARIHPLIGMGSDQMLEDLFGEERSDLKDGHTKGFEAFTDEIHAFPGAGDILREVHRRGGRVVLCTSSQKAHLEPMLEQIDADDAIDEIVNGDDVSESKPAPDVFAVGLEKAGQDASRSLAVGDTVWDVRAAAKLDVKCVCVLTGGATREQLEKEGAIAVYEDVADLLAHFDDSPLAKLLASDA